MCSNSGATSRPSHAAEPLAVVAQAIADLASENLGSLTSAELSGRVASVWTLIGNMDPELARRAAGYARGSAEPTPGRRPHRPTEPGPAGSQQDVEPAAD